MATSDDWSDGHAVWNRSRPLAVAALCSCRCIVRKVRVMIAGGGVACLLWRGVVPFAGHYP